MAISLFVVCLAKDILFDSLRSLEKKKPALVGVWGVCVWGGGVRGEG